MAYVMFQYDRPTDTQMMLNRGVEYSLSKAPPFLLRNSLCSSRLLRVML